MQTGAAHLLKLVALVAAWPHLHVRGGRGLERLAFSHSFLERRGRAAFVFARGPASEEEGELVGELGSCRCAEKQRKKVACWESVIGPIPDHGLVLRSY